MKRFHLILVTLLALAGSAVAQTQQPVVGLPTQETAPQQQHGRPQPMAQTQEEFDAFQKAGNTSSLGEAVAAADAFALQFPQSELRTLLYMNLMHRYQEENDAENTVAMGRKVLEVEPDNPSAAVTVATVLAERTRETDLDRDERLAEASRLAKLAIENADTGMIIPVGTPTERVELAKHTLLAMAHGALGTIEMQREDHAAAEEHLRAATGFDKAQPDPVLYLRLSVALDHQKKYQEAHAAADRSFEIAGGQGPVANLARQQRDRLSRLMAAGTQPQQPQPAPTAPQPQPVPPQR
jgi:tetratricopeptide (TPR) repeat protein